MKNNFFLKIFSVVLLVLLFNFLIVQIGHSRLDLTSEKKYTLSKQTKNILKSIDDRIYFKIYFTGKLFTPELKSLKKEIDQLLSEFKYYNKLIDYEFIDLYSINKKENLNKKIYELSQNNVNWTFHPKLKDQFIIWGAEISYKTNYEGTVSFLNDLDKEWPIECAGENDNLTNCIYENYAERCLNHLEFSLIKSIKNALNHHEKKKKIGIIGGHGENNGDWIYSLKKNLRTKENYIVTDTIMIHQSNEFSELYDVIDGDNTDYKYNLSDFDCLIINNPSDSIFFLEKIILDQYIMNGGKTFWLIKGSQTNIDSLQKNPQIPVVERNINIRNMLYKYGVRINSNIARDYNNSGIKLTEYSTGLLLPFPWDYFPVVSGKNNHKISRGIGNIMTQFPSTIDTIENNISKHILLQTSEYSTTSNLMDVVSFNDVNFMNNKDLYKKRELILGVLLEGEFNSNFKNRIPETYKEKLNFIDKCNKKNKMIVISDGNFITNQIGRSKQSRLLELDKNNRLFVTPELKIPLALGYDRNSFKKYNNLYLALNSLNYLLEEEQENYLFEIRKKETKINKLDKVLLEERSEKWKIINLTVPLLYVLIIFLTSYFLRRMKYN